ncbi:uncharacterized protein K460DRAFT_45154 [Cucurbitaria berberidis CBS 394.84]|uniref:Uncharacterized protein n=1 Tax=Cucurbitaria berberidis CBS 394.84 TaxID=1168544 RepID=A0A9P4GUX6_9PLEO|nr:uncharacterized protein K460DRAFT_45154 [Cucurbitaria berberidis CBS 394.84]KAF1851999.1 hypothetical protein K460DRAFT_45154 [Cucurbitaria berberidis CBS 394.84]
MSRAMRLLISSSSLHHQLISTPHILWYPLRTRFLPSSAGRCLALFPYLAPSDNFELVVKAAPPSYYVLAFLVCSQGVPGVLCAIRPWQAVLGHDIFTLPRQKAFSSLLDSTFSIFAHLELSRHPSSLKQCQFRAAPATSFATRLVFDYQQLRASSSFLARLDYCFAFGSRASSI